MTAPLCPDCGMIRRPDGLRCECLPTPALDAMSRTTRDFLGGITTPIDYAQPRLSDIYAPSVTNSNARRCPNP